MGSDRMGAHRRDLPVERARHRQLLRFRCQLAGQFLMLLAMFGNNVGGPFTIFGVFSALSIPFVLRFVPETKGKSLEQIEEEMVRR